MATKRGLVTDSFKMLKKAKRRGEKKEKKPTPPPQQKGEEQRGNTWRRRGRSPDSRLIGAEAEGQTARQEGLEKLRHFDLDWRFGPCTGISRLDRWERAKGHGLNPPGEIRDLLLHTQADPEYSHSLWRDYPL
ncbi:DNA polymerase delta subunit 4 isoform X1 [Brachionichthys hirsutus]|uniref:DNA polymerase delta subunit 4 isoform X1 n=1 Tax=Brachionichthys hirsutus TaxID=412623 RepID=UPI0036044DC7